VIFLLESGFGTKARALRRYFQFC